MTTAIVGVLVARIAAGGTYFGIARRLSGKIATSEAAERGIRGGAVTPFVLGRVAELSSGRTLRTNIGLIINNAQTAARIAVALAGPSIASTA